MRLRILSDLHLEVAPWTFEPVGEDLVILAGDVCDRSTVGRQRRDNLFAQIAQAGLRALYVLGNHEGYQGQLSLSELVKRIRSECSDHVRLLDRESLDVGGFRFLGCSLWTDFSLVDGLKWRGLVLSQAEAAYVAGASINDFKHFCADGIKPRPLTPENMLEWYRRDRAWLDQTITASTLPTVVISHFLPGPASVAEEFKTSVLTPYFASDCRALMRAPVQLWVHGHTHVACAYRHGEVRVICNPRGYAREERHSGFVSDLVVELPVRKIL
jgi:predicted phosphodiesterase